MEKVIPKVWVVGINTSTPLTALDNFAIMGFERRDELDFDLPIGPKDSLLVLDANPKALNIIADLRLPKSRCILVRNEPIVVCPLNYQPSTEALFGKIIDVGRKLPASTMSVPCPRKVWRSTPFTPRQKRSDTPVLMNANKMSFVKGELYSLRRTLLHHVHTDLFGPNWDSSYFSRLKTFVAELWIALAAKQRISWRALSSWFAKHPNWRGLSADKFATYLKYKYVFAIENSADYMSEKLMDALTAGCIPIYVGPPVEEFGIPSDLVVTSQPTVFAVLEGLIRAGEIDEESWRKRLLEFLANPETQFFWDEKRIYGEIAKHIFANDPL